MRVLWTSGTSLWLLGLLAAGGCAAGRADRAPATEPAAEADGGSDGGAVEAASRGVAPEGARIALVAEAPRALLGENLLVHYVVSNGGTRPFPVSFGGDYRGASRALRIQVLAFDSEGHELEDPDPSGFCLGGLGGTQQVGPGESFTFSFQLHRYRRVEVAGTYRIRAAHDLGWSGEDGEQAEIAGDDPRWAETTVELVAPSGAEAEEVVGRMAALPEDPDARVGERIRPFADWSALRYAVYLPSLERRAVGGSGARQALAAIGQIPTPEATATLLRLARVCPAGPECSEAALSALLYRLPDPQLEGALPPRNPFEDAQAAPRRYLSGKAWAPRFAPEARELAKGLLASGEEARLRAGAFLLEAVGEASDAPPLTAALDRAVEGTRSLALETDVYPRPRGACMELLRAARMLAARGAVPPREPRSPGEIALYLVANGHRTDGRPRDYGRRAAAWLAHPVPYVRELVLTETGAPIPPEIVDRLAAVLASDDVDSRIAALQLARDLGDERFRPDALRVARTANEEWLIRAAVDAAFALGAPRDELAAALVDRLDETDRTMLVFDLALGLVLSARQGSSMDGEPDLAEARRLQAAWRAFLQARGPELAAGRLLDPAAPGFPVDLLPFGFGLRLPDGTELARPALAECPHALPAEGALCAPTAAAACTYSEAGGACHTRIATCRDGHWRVSCLP